MADVFELGARLADLCLFEPHLGPRTPAENGEGARADLAFLAVLFLHHAEVGVVAETCLTQDGKFGILPVLTIVGVGGL